MKIRGLGCAAATALSFTVLNGCGRDRLVNQADAPVSKQEESLAHSGAAKLRGLFNKGQCQAIFHDAAFADDCARLHEDMGLWKSFDPSSAVSCGGRQRIVCIDGLAQFENRGHSLVQGTHATYAR